MNIEKLQERYTARIKSKQKATRKGQAKKRFNCAITHDDKSVIDFNRCRGLHNQHQGGT